MSMELFSMREIFKNFVVKVNYFDNQKNEEPSLSSPSAIFLYNSSVPTLY